jgi:hypothetical protein
MFSRTLRPFAGPYGRRPGPSAFSLGRRPAPSLRHRGGDRSGANELPRKSAYERVRRSNSWSFARPAASSCRPGRLVLAPGRAMAVCRAPRLASRQLRASSDARSQHGARLLSRLGRAARVTEPHPTAGASIRCSPNPPDPARHARLPRLRIVASRERRQPYPRHPRLVRGAGNAPARADHAEAPASSRQHRSAHSSHQHRLLG